MGPRRRAVLRILVAATDLGFTITSAWLLWHAGFTASQYLGLAGVVYFSAMAAAWAVRKQARTLAATRERFAPIPYDVPITEQEQQEAVTMMASHGD